VALLACSLAAALTAPSSHAFASEALYVDPHSVGGACSDDRPAEEVSPATPWCSLGHALEAAPDGSVVLLRRGAHEAAEVRRREGSELVTFRPFRDEEVTLGGLSIEESSHLRFEGFTIRGRTSITFGSRIELVDNDIAREGITIRPSDRVLIEGNRIHDLTFDGPQAGAGYGVALIGGWNDPARPQTVTNVTIRGNTFSWVPADGIQAGQVENLLIEDNEFHDVTAFLEPDEHSDGIQLHGQATDVTIRRNFFHDQPNALIAKRSIFRGLVIENNLMVRLSGIALNIYDAPGARIVNNTIWDTAAALRFNDLPEVPVEMSGAVVANNIVDRLWFGPEHVAVEDHNIIGTRTPGTAYGPNDLFGEPGFVSQRLLDYRLGRSSPAVDSGAAEYAPATDREGRRRLDVDRGALEYVPSQGGWFGPAVGILVQHAWRLLG
jgi:parallel beta helix pectate lyase-like protein